MRLIRRGLRRPLRTLASLDAYAQWAVAYPPVPHNPLMQAEQDAMLALLPDVTGQTWLDMACGSGRYGRLLVERGAAYVVGVDNSLPMLRTGQGAGVPVGLSLGTTNAAPLGAGCVDGVLCGLALGHLPVLLPSMAEVARVLKPGGMALVSDFHPDLFARGGRRTFTGADGTVYAVEHYTHDAAAYQQAAGAAGLAIIEQRVPTLSIAGQTEAVAVVYALRRV